MRTFVIAEPGSTHDGVLDDMLRLVDVAVAAGASAIKFQWVSDPDALCRRRNAPEYLEAYARLAFPFAWHGSLMARAHIAGLQYGCTAFLPQDVARLDTYVDFYKVAAFEAECADLLDAYAARQWQQPTPKALIVSLGLGADGLRAHVRCAAVRRLRCVSAYPTPFADLQLGRIRAERLSGLSDHTPAEDPRSEWVGALAVTAGATVLERHIRLDACDAHNPDYAVSMKQRVFASYVHHVRLAEEMLGDGTTGAMPSETPMLRYRARAEVGS